MIDTIMFRNHLEDYNDIDERLKDIYKDRIISKLTNLSKLYFEDQRNTVIRGMFKNFKVSISGYMIRFSGSLAKYYNGQNVTMLSKQDISLALKQLKNELGVPIGRAIITRFDVSTVLPLTEKPKKYQELLIGIHPNKVQQDRNTVHISRTNTKVVIYDKYKEIDPVLRNHFAKVYGTTNLLRFELRFIENLSEEFNRKYKPIRLAYLHSPSFLKSAAWKFVDHYASIQKKQVENIKGIKSWSGLKDYVFFEWVKIQATKGGVEDILDVFKMINTIGKANGWNPQNMRNGRVAAKKIFSEGNFLEKHSLVDEMDEKVLHSDLVQEFIIDK